MTAWARKRTIWGPPLPYAYRRANGAVRAPAADGGAFADDALEDLYR